MLLAQLLEPLDELACILLQVLKSELVFCAHLETLGVEELKDGLNWLSRAAMPLLGWMVTAGLRREAPCHRMGRSDHYFIITLLYECCRSIIKPYELWSAQGLLLDFLRREGVGR